MTESAARGRVLVVDDDEQIRRMFDAALRRADFDVEHAVDADSAIRAVESKAFDVVLLDVGLPDRSGVEVIRQLRSHARHRTLPVVLVTGRQQVDDRVRGLEAGADDYVVKPVRPDELVARVTAQMRSRDAWSEVVEQMFDERARVLNGIAAIHEDELESAAAAACDVLASTCDVEHAAIVVFRSEHVATVIAATVAGNPSSPPTTLYGETVERLRRRARQGIMMSSPESPDVLGDLLPPTSTGVGAPIPGSSGPRGVLVLGSSVRAGAGTDPLDRVLATAADAAPAVATLLAPHLERDVDDKTRDRILHIVEGTRFGVVFQPVIEVGSRSVVGYEALTRFDDGGPPGTTFGDAARVGLGGALERVTLAYAVDAAKALPAERWLSLNVSVDFLTHDRGPREIVASCPRPVVLELTERDPVDDYAEVRAALRQVSGHVRLAIDDVGSGYASLRHVFTLNPHFVKLDRSWLAGIVENEIQRELLGGIADFARRTGISMIVEGVEHAREDHLVRELGIPYAQGYFYGRPAPAEEWSARAPG